MASTQATFITLIQFSWRERSFPKPFSRWAGGCLCMKLTYFSCKVCKTAVIDYAIIQQWISRRFSNGKYSSVRWFPFLSSNNNNSHKSNSFSSREANEVMSNLRDSFKTIRISGKRCNHALCILYTCVIFRFSQKHSSNFMQSSKIRTKEAC